MVDWSLVSIYDLGEYRWHLSRALCTLLLYFIFHYIATCIVYTNQRLRSDPTARQLPFETSYSEHIQILLTAIHIFTVVWHDKSDRHTNIRTYLSYPIIFSSPNSKYKNDCFPSMHCTIWWLLYIQSIGIHVIKPTCPKTTSMHEFSIIKYTLHKYRNYDCANFPLGRDDN